MISLKIVNSTEQFLELESAWNDLTEEPLRSFDWNFSWWKSFGDDLELRIYVCQCDGKVVGIAPFFVDSWLGQQRLRFLGSGDTCSDYAQIISLPSCREEFAAKIGTDISDSSSISMVELEGVCVETHDELVCQRLDNSFWRYEGTVEPTWVLSVPDTWEQFVAQSKKSLRRKIKKAVKRLDQAEVVVCSTREQMDVHEAFDILVELHQQRFESKGKPGVFSNPKFSSFLKMAIIKLAQKDRAEILVGYANDQPIAAQLYLLGDSGPQLYQCGVRIDSMKLEPGHLLFTFAVRKAIENGFHVFDFLRGSEPYKPFWGAVPRQLRKIRCVSNNLFPTTINKTYRFLRSVKHSYSTLVTRNQVSH